MYVRDMVMLVITFATTIKLRATTIIYLMQQFMFDKKHQRTKKRRSVNRHHTLLHIGQRKGMIILDNILQHQQPYGCRPYACFYQ